MAPVSAQVALNRDVLTTVDDHRADIDGKHDDEQHGGGTDKHAVRREGYPPPGCRQFAQNHIRPLPNAPPDFPKSLANLPLKRKEMHVNTMKYIGKMAKNLE